MKIKHNVSISQICWLHAPTIDMGQVANLYYPETIDELSSLCKNLQETNQKYFVFGHMSNSYFKSNFTPPHLIVTSRLRGIVNDSEYVVCECGVHIKQIARLMVNEGAEGFDGLWDLPGTVAAAVYGNAGCFGCEMKDIFYSADIFTPDGSMQTLYANDLGFCRRCSKLKTGQIKGVILRVTLYKRKGNAELIKEKARQAHDVRVKTQPGPQNNLGSCFMSGKRTIMYRILQRMVAVYIRIANKKPSEFLKYELMLLGHRNLIPYLYDMNRFIWKDEYAYELFDDYVCLYKKLYKNAHLEINVFE